jgi:hypothetical protein
MSLRESQDAVALLAKIVVLTVVAFVGGLASGIFLIQLGTYSDNDSTQEAEVLELSNQHVWVDQSGWGEAAILVLNTGGRDAPIWHLWHTSLI